MPKYRVIGIAERTQHVAIEFVMDVEEGKQRDFHNNVMKKAHVMLGDDGRQWKAIADNLVDKKSKQVIKIALIE